MVKKEARKVVLKDAQGGYLVPVIDPADKGNKGGSGLEICDIGMALYVDETKGLRRYLNGQIVDVNTNTQAFLNRLKQITTRHPSLLCTEEEWQTAKTMSAFGQVGKFVFNYTNDGVTVVSVRIPAIVNVQGLFDLQNLGMTVEAGLPNVRTNNWVGIYSNYTSSGGGLVKSGTQSNGAVQGGDQRAMYRIDLSQGNPIYGKSATVQPEAIQYPYFIQIATGSETENNIINDIELNNPYSLFDSKYSDHELNNLSWLKSEGQWNSKAVYPTAYDKLLKVYNGTETVEGLSVKLSTETYTDYDFVLNTADETFRLPLKTKQKFYDNTASVVGNGMTLGLTNGTGFGAWSQARTDRDYNAITPAGYGKPVTAGFFSTNPIQGTYGVTTDPTKSGIETHLTETTLYLYFYVGETVQNANLIDAGRIGEMVANKVDISNTQWATSACMPDYSASVAVTMPYTAPSNGWFVASDVNTTAIIKINNVQVAKGDWAPNYWSGNLNCQIMVAEGDVITGATGTMNFMPCKGVN